MIYKLFIGRSTPLGSKSMYYSRLIKYRTPHHDGVVAIPSPAFAIPAPVVRLSTVHPSHATGGA